MAQVSVLGLGAMGSRLATVLLERGHEVTVWNRCDLGAGGRGGGGRRGASRLAGRGSRGGPAGADVRHRLPGGGRGAGRARRARCARRARVRPVHQRHRAAGPRTARAGVGRRRGHALRRHRGLPAAHRPAGDADPVRRRRRGVRRAPDDAGRLGWRPALRRRGPRADERGLRVVVRVLLRRAR